MNEHQKYFHLDSKRLRPSQWSLSALLSLKERGSLQVTGTGHALHLAAVDHHSDADAGSCPPVKINLLDSRFRKDTQPLVLSCRCFSCKNHTRAYIHHLLNVHEMTAQVLLELHNVHQMLQWIREVRESIADSSFQSFHRLNAGRLKGQTVE